ncbi:MBL fold metallo-hydrolase [Georgenia sp. AZ-5]|uniref:MBL fold metallo-hydrolase n=1 Tax=Georgenia sp. AZ-5 TaxID=3367526 RepID=UPI0037541821
MLQRDVADGVHQVEHAHVNCYLVEDDDGVTLVDAGLPAFWPLLGQALREIGRRPSDVRALVITHGHFDHVGIARRLQQRLGVPVWAHEKEHHLVAHPYRYAHENLRGIYPLRYPRGAVILGAMARAGALTVRGATATHQLSPTAMVDVPGQPRVVFTPGHTYGHCALHLPGRRALLTGDALVTLDPYTGHTGPRIIAGAATADSEMALRSLDALAATDADVVLPGHGEVWRSGAAAAVEHARAAGSA